MKKSYILGLRYFFVFSKELQGKAILLLLVLFGFLNAQGQVGVSGAVTGDGEYTTLGAAFAAIASSQTGANIVITIRGNTAETSTAILNAGDWASVVISPSGGAWTVTGSIAADLIRFNGADNVTVNGLNSGGNSLTFSNTSTSNTSGTSTIKFINDASNNTITNCTLLGSATVGVTSQGGVVFFHTGSITGNDNNTISNCSIGPAGSILPSKLIFSTGTSTSPSLYNSGITITGCKLYDYFLGTGCAGIYIATGNTDWTVTNNKIYQTAPRNFTAAASMYGVYFGNPTGSNNIQINGNTIGYANDSATGTLTLTSSAVNGSFYGIYLFASSTAPDPCSISNNTIANVSLSSVAGSINGIYNTTPSGTSAININGNIIRDLTAVNTTGSLTGLYAGSAASLDCSNNVVAYLSRNAAGPFYGISFAGPASVTLDSNSITNLNSTAADNGSNIIAGIYSNTTAQSEQFINNTITDLTSASTASGINIYGINNGTGTTGNKVFVGNTIGNFSLPDSGTGKIYGIKLNGGGVQNSILGNTIFSLSGGNAINGIVITVGATNNVSKNKIHGLSSASAGAVVCGMNLTGGTTHNVYNNILGNLYVPAGDNAAGAPNQVVGINASNAITALNLYHNTIKIDAQSTGVNFGTSAVYVDVNPVLTMRNNILVNTSGANGTGLSVVLRKPSLTYYDAASNNNLFYGTAIYTDGTNTDATLSAFRARLVNRDGLSVSENPNFTSTTGSDATYLHINNTMTTQIDNGGANIAMVAEDFDGNARNASTPDIGADEFTSVVMGNEEFRANEFKYYPNPVKDILNVESTLVISSMEVCAITGQKVGLKAINETKTTFDMSELPRGVYLVKVIADDEVKTIRVIKK